MGSSTRPAAPSHQTQAPDHPKDEEDVGNNSTLKSMDIERQLPCGSLADPAPCNAGPKIRKSSGPILPAASHDALDYPEPGISTPAQLPPALKIQQSQMTTPSRHLKSNATVNFKLPEPSFISASEENDEDSVVPDGPPVIPRSISIRNLLMNDNTQALGLAPRLSQGGGLSVNHALSQSRTLRKLSGSASVGIHAMKQTSVRGSVSANDLPSILPQHPQQLQNHVMTHAHLSGRPSIYYHHPLGRRTLSIASRNYHRAPTACISEKPAPPVVKKSQRSRFWWQAGRPSAASSAKHPADSRRPAGHALSKSFAGSQPDNASDGRILTTSIASTGHEQAQRSAWWKVGLGKRGVTGAFELPAIAAPEGIFEQETTAGPSGAGKTTDAENSGSHGGTKGGLSRRGKAAGADGKTGTWREPRPRKGGSVGSVEAEPVVPDEVVNNVGHAQRAMAAQAEFIRSFGMSSQLLGFLQINATVLSFDVRWPPALMHFVRILRVFILDFHIFRWKYSSLLVSFLFPCLCYYVSEMVWRNSATWRGRYIDAWPKNKAIARKICTYSVILTGLVCISLVSADVMLAVDAFAVTWVVSVVSALAYLVFVGTGNMGRKLFIILEKEEDRMRFFLQVRYALRYAVLIALNLAYLPLLTKLFEIIYTAKHHHEEGRVISPVIWIVALVLAALYGVGFPVAIYRLLARRRSVYEWVPDPTNSIEGGKYQPKAEVVVALAGWKGVSGEKKGKMDVEDDDLLAYNYLELEQQVNNLKHYARSMPLITDGYKRKAVLRRVRISLRQKRIAARQSRHWTEAAYEMAHGHPIDDYWRSLRPQFSWWKLWAYFIQRGLLVALIVTQDGQGMARSLSTIVASVVLIGGTALTLLTCSPFIRRTENMLESFIDVCSTFNVSVALSLHQGWLVVSPTGVPWVLYLILAPNLVVILVAIYILNPLALWRAFRFKYKQFQERSMEHRAREKELADRESRALFEAAFRGEVRRVHDLLEQGLADVRYEKPKDVKPVGFAGYSPTQIAVYMGRADVLELLLAHHTLFTEEELVKGAIDISRHSLLFRWVVVPIAMLGPSLRDFSASCTRFSLNQSKHVQERRPQFGRAVPRLSLSRTLLSISGKGQLPVAPAEKDDCCAQAMAPRLIITSAQPQTNIGPISGKHPGTNNPQEVGSQPESSQSTADVSVGAYIDSHLGGGHGHLFHQENLGVAPGGERPGTRDRAWGRRKDSIAMDVADRALVRCKSERGNPTAWGPDEKKGQWTDQENYFSLVGLAFCSWSRDCLDLLLTYGSEAYDKEPLYLNQGQEKRIRALPQADIQEQRSFVSEMHRELYKEASTSSIDIKLRQTAAAALHHPRDLQWILDPDRGNVIEERERADGAVRFLVKVCRKIKHDHKSTKDMKILAMKALVEEVHAKGLMRGATLRLDLSYMGIDDLFLEHILYSLWDVTATGMPTSLQLEGNALTDYGVRSLVSKMRENMFDASGSSLGDVSSDGDASEEGTQALEESGKGASGAPSPMSTASSRHAARAGGDRAHASSIVSLNLTGNDVGTDGALFLADYIADYQASLRSVVIFKVECSMLSARSMAYDRVVDRSLSLESALVLAIIVDAYGGVRDGLMAPQDRAPEILSTSEAPSFPSVDLKAGPEAGSGWEGVEGLNAPTRLFSGCGGQKAAEQAASPSYQAQQQSNPPERDEARFEMLSAVRQVLAMGEKEGWNKRLINHNRNK